MLTRNCEVTLRECRINREASNGLLGKQQLDSLIPQIRRGSLSNASQRQHSLVAQHYEFNEHHSLERAARMNQALLNVRRKNRLCGRNVFDYIWKQTMAGFDIAHIPMQAWDERFVPAHRTATHLYSSAAQSCTRSTPDFRCSIACRRNVRALRCSSRRISVSQMLMRTAAASERAYHVQPQPII